MNISIRQGTFETNSSSMHSLTVGNGHRREYNLSMVMYFGEFGWGYDVVHSPEEKLSYIVTQFMQKLKKCLRSNTQDLEKYCRIIFEIFSNSIFISSLSEKIKEHIGNKLYVIGCCTSNHPFGYVDHQSDDLLDEYFFGTAGIDYSDSLDVMLAKITCPSEDSIDKLVDIIFDNSEIIIDHDNHP